MREQFVLRVRDYQSIGLYAYELDLKDLEHWRENYAIVAEDTGLLKATNRIGITEARKRNGEKVTLRVVPRFKNLDPLKMLEELTRDEEFLTYAEQGEEPLYRIFADHPPVKAPSRGDGEALSAISFVMRLYNLCRKQLKPQMTQWEENMNGKVKGRIVFKTHLQKNVLRGMEHRVYCRYSLNTVDNPENRILKAALRQARKILQKFFRHQRQGGGALAARIAYCQHALRDVSERKITARDFAAVRTSGYYAYYKPVLSLAKHLLTRSFAGVREEDSGIETEVVPYCIDMQKLFEVYIYSKLKELSGTRLSDPASVWEYEVELLNRPYGRKYPLTHAGGKGSGDKPFIEVDERMSGSSAAQPPALHIQGNVCPDFYLAISRKRKGEDAVAERKTVVLDAKYKHAEMQNRSDTLQIFAYAYIFDADATGFVFPLENRPDHLAGKIRDKPDQRYFELVLSIGTSEPAGERAERHDVEGFVRFMIRQLFSPAP